MSSIAFSDMEFGFPIAIGILIMVIAMGLKLKRERIDIFFDKHKFGSRLEAAAVQVGFDRRAALSKISYDNLIINGKFSNLKGPDQYLKYGKLLGVDIRDIGCLRDLPVDVGRLSVFVSSGIEIKECLSKSSKGSGFLLLLMSSSNFDVKLIS